MSWKVSIRPNWANMRLRLTVLAKYAAISNLGRILKLDFCTRLNSKEWYKCTTS